MRSSRSMSAIYVLVVTSTCFSCQKAVKGSGLCADKGHKYDVTDDVCDFQCTNTSYIKMCTCAMVTGDISSLLYVFVIKSLIMR